MAQHRGAEQLISHWGHPCQVFFHEEAAHIYVHLCTNTAVIRPNTHSCKAVSSVLHLCTASFRSGASARHRRGYSVLRKSPAQRAAVRVSQQPQTLRLIIWDSLSQECALSHVSLLTTLGMTVQESTYTLVVNIADGSTKD